MDLRSKIYVAGHRGLVGSAILRHLKQRGYSQCIYRTHEELDLCNQRAVIEFFEEEKPEYVFLAAAKVGGILANKTYRADFIYQNLMIQSNIIEQSYRHGVKKLLFLGSTCIYPKHCEQPIKEEYLLQSPLEYSNEPYAIAKIAGMKMCESYNIQHGCNFISAMPTNLYGPYDNFDLQNSHALPALMRKMHLAQLLREDRKEELLHDIGIARMEAALNYLKERGISAEQVEIWGSGNPRRDFLYSEDMVAACMHIIAHVDFKDLIVGSGPELRNTHINIGSGNDLRIRELAEIIKNVVGFEGKLKCNSSMPDGTPRKLADINRMQELGWTPTTSLEDGIAKTYNWYTSQR